MAIAIALCGCNDLRHNDLGPLDGSFSKAIFYDYGKNEENL